jgi:hypothetical protein
MHSVGTAAWRWIQVVEELLRAPARHRHTALPVYSGLPAEKDGPSAGTAS